MDELEAAAASKDSEKRKGWPLCRECFVGGLKPVMLWGHTQKNKLPGQRKRGSEVKAPAKTKRAEGLKVPPDPTPAPPKAASGTVDDLDQAKSKKRKADLKAFFKPACAPPNDVAPKATAAKEPPKPVNQRAPILIPSCDGFVGKESIEQLGIIQDVPGDGNCGCHAAQKGLCRLETEHEASTMSFRKSLHNHARQREDKFLGGGDDWEIHNEGFERKNGKTAMQLRRDWWDNEVASKMWREDMNFEKGAAACHHLDSDAHWPIFADKFGVSVVCHNTRGGDLFTSACKLQDIGLECEPTLGFKSPSELGLDKSSSSTVQIVHVNSNHFMSVAVK